MRLISLSGACRGAVVLAIMVGLAGCVTAQSTPLIVYVTPTPAPTATATQTAKATHTAMATATATTTATTASTPTPTSKTTPSAAPTGSPEPSATATATAAPTASATACTGADKPANLTFWTDTASHEPWTMYCGVVPSPWYFNAANATWGAGGLLTIQYKTTSGGEINVQEGTVSTNFCALPTGIIGSAKFGPTLTGTMYSATVGYALCTSSSGKTYQIKGTNVVLTTFTSIAAAMIVVPKS